MNWLEFSVAADNEAAEAVVELFNRYGRGGAVVEMQIDCFEHDLVTAAPPPTVLVKTYLPLDGSASDHRLRLEEALWHLAQIYPIPEPAVRELPEEDWANAWKQQYHPLRVGRRIVIVPDWEAFAPESDDVVIRLEPGMAFGTGLHPTTRLCLQALELHLDTPGLLLPSVLDVGTGSGVLAIAAARLGAGPVLALDADAMAVTVARENVARNDVSELVTVRQGTLPGSTFKAWLPKGPGEESAIPLLEGGRFDRVVINILAPVIVGMAPALAARTASGGRLIAAGFVESQEADVERALLAEGFQVIDRLQEKDWVCLVAWLARGDPARALGADPAPAMVADEG